MSTRYNFSNCHFAVGDVRGGGGGKGRRPMCSITNQVDCNAVCTHSCLRRSKNDVCEVPNS